MTVPSKTKSAKSEYNALRMMVEEIDRQCPQRRPAGEDERQAQMIMKKEFERLGLATEVHQFEFNESLYANIALHFGLGTLGTVVSGVLPLAGLALHLTAGTSYWADSTRRAFLLRRLFPFKPSRNILGTMPSKGEPALRIVFAAHADTAFTGLMFRPEIVKLIAVDKPGMPGFLKRPMSMATKTQFALAGFDLLRLLGGPLTLPLRPLEALLTVPSFLIFLLNLQVVLKNEIVPGANDNLSGMAALPLLAQRLASIGRDDVEFVFVVTGCEEACLGGSDALARAREGIWDKSRTVLIGLDGLGNGDLCYTASEGEVVPLSTPAWLMEILQEVALSEPRFAGVHGVDLPAGGTDAGPFLAHGWDGVSLVCEDPALGVPLHYHTPEDSPENLDLDKVIYSIDFTEKLTHTIIRKRLG